MFIIGHKPRHSLYVERFIHLQHLGKQDPHDVGTTSTLDGLLVAVIITRDKCRHGIGWKPTKTYMEPQSLVLMVPPTLTFELELPMNECKGRGEDHVAMGWIGLALAKYRESIYVKQCVHIPSYRSGFRSQDSLYVPIVRFPPKIVSSNKGLGGPNSRLQCFVGDP